MDLSGCYIISIKLKDIIEQRSQGDKFNNEKVHFHNNFVNNNH